MENLRFNLTYKKEHITLESLHLDLSLNYLFTETVLFHNFKISNTFKKGPVTNIVIIQYQMHGVPLIHLHSRYGS